MFADLNVFVVWNMENRGATKKPPSDHIEQPSPSNYHPAASSQQLLPDDAFSTSAKQLTKREIRGLVLAELALGPNEVLWDIGAGSGAVAIDAGRQQPSAQIFAVEKRPELLVHARQNMQTHGVDNVSLVEGVAPSVCVNWPDPNTVFVGGSGGQLEAIVAMITKRLPTDGRLVINLATIENLATVRKLLPQAQITQVQISRGAPILEMTRFEALNPVFMVVWRKK